MRNMLQNFAICNYCYLLLQETFLTIYAWCILKLKTSVSKVWSMQSWIASWTTLATFYLVGWNCNFPFKRYIIPQNRIFTNPILIWAICMHAWEEIKEGNIKNMSIFHDWTSHKKPCDHQWSLLWLQKRHIQNRR